MNKTIEVVVSPQGEAKIETKGFAGSSCRDVSKALEAALGLQVSERRTAEFFQTLENPSVQIHPTK